MNRPPHPRMMGNMYRSPRPYNNQWRPRGPRPNAGFQWRGNSHPRPPAMSPQFSPNQNNQEHWCETCDRGFATPDLLSKHLQQHQKCNIDGCQFVAHPKVITKHIQMQHSSGLYKKIAKLNNPEEIQKWRDERKKKYPTRTNIEKKAAECKEKIERGEKMALKRDRSDNNKSTDQAPHTNRRDSFSKNYQNHRNNRPNFTPRQNNMSDQEQPRPPPPKKIRKPTPSIPSVVEKNKLKPFAGILSINMDDEIIEEVSNPQDSTNILIEDDYFEMPAPPPKDKPVQEPVICGALSSLMCDYGSSDDEAKEKENKEVGNVITTKALNKNVNSDSTKKAVANVNKDPTTNKNINEDLNKEKGLNKNCSETVVGNVNDDCKDKEQTNNDISTKLNDLSQNVEKLDNEKRNESDDDSGPEEVTTVKSNVTEPVLPEDKIVKPKEPAVPVRKNIPPRNNNNRQHNKYHRKIPSTLLYKLLHKEIRHERNIVLQCIRYIKKMNYFDKTPH
ncbi:nuclear FMR1 interacting protein 1 [Anticarsia gemmatalis]|uniref:nuclear FMR1 interacting protein 1 n=1 Tax=Anticarsia gemmatalis TaxID=129554 RepID=UPI003F77533A